MTEFWIYISHTLAFTKIKTVLTVIIWFIATLIGWFTILIKALFLLLIIDFILWFTLAWINHNISRKKLNYWIWKIVAYCIALIVLNLTSIAILNFNINGFWLLEFGIAYLALNEAISALNHLSRLWVPIPIAIVNKLEKYKSDLDNNE